MVSRGLIEGIAYLRTSSSTNVGADKDSDKRQREKITAFAKANGFVIVDEFYDADVSGDDALKDRPGFAALVDRIADNGVRVVIVEDVTRFARKLVTQEQGIAFLINLGVTLYTSGGENLCETDDPYRIAFRQIGGVFAELEKALLVRKLRSARERKSQKLGYKIDVRKTVDVLYPDATKRAKYLSRYKKLSLRGIAATLAAEGFTTKGKGTPFNPKVIKSMIDVRGAPHRKCA
jgi:DNA invertase Pin-like site-specific DNA recombinase